MKAKQMKEELAKAKKMLQELVAVCGTQDDGAIAAVAGTCQEFLDKD